MALFKFTSAILEGRPIDIYNHGDMQRDFTYIDDIVEGVYRVMGHVPGPDPAWSGDAPDPGVSFAPYRIFNIGGAHPVGLMHFIGVLERALGREAAKNMLPLQPGDVKATCADALDLEDAVGFRPLVPVETGIERFVEWYRSYYRV
jgi:UDP-glucuronate 4-epimerase